MSKYEPFTVYEVFTPTTQARLNFVNRDSVNDYLVDALRTPGKQVVVYGESGSGKSTLLQKKLEELYTDHLTSRCSASTTYESLLFDAFDQLNQYYVDEKTDKRGRRTSAQLGSEFSIVKAELNFGSDTERSETGKRILSPQLTAQRLGQFIGAQELCWVLEDFHKVPTEHKTLLSQTFKIFSDLASSYPSLRIVAIGATETAREVIQYDPEMRNRVAELQVPLMTPDELYAILANGSKLLRVDFSAVASDIVSFSSGLASVTHHLALNACLAADASVPGPSVVTIRSEHLEAAVARYIDESSDTLKALLDVALVRHRERKYDNMRLILAALAAGPVEGLSHAAIRAQIQEQEPNYPAGNVTTYLAKLTTAARGQIVIKSASGDYRFRDPVVHSYARAVLGVKAKREPWSDQFNSVILLEVERALDSSFMKIDWKRHSQGLLNEPIAVHWSFGKKK